MIKVCILLEETVRRSEIARIGAVHELKVRDALLAVIERHPSRWRGVCQEPGGVLVGTGLCALGNAGREERRFAALQLAPDVVVERRHPQALWRAGRITVRQAGGIGNDFALAANPFERSADVGLLTHGTPIGRT